MNEEICQCGHPKNTHMVFDKPAFGITHICGVNLCDCEQFRPTPRALDGAVRCPNCDKSWDKFFCAECGYCAPPRQ